MLWDSDVLEGDVEVAMLGYAGEIDWDVELCWEDVHVV